MNGKTLSKVFYNGKLIYPVDEATSVLMDICFYDKQNDSLIIVKGDEWYENTDNYPIEDYTPVGVVVVPAEHDVYGDGSCGVMSLVEMSASTPDTGGTAGSSLAWGGITPSTLTAFGSTCYVGQGNTLYKDVQGVSSEARLPSDRFTTINNPYDPDTGYYYSTGYQAPSPYNADGSRNPAYYQIKAPSSEENGLSDFDGIGNSEVLWRLATAQENWKTDETIIVDNINGSYYFPAACCCWRFHTDGTEQGDWYLPSTGELGYAMVRANKIDETITSLMNIYGNSIGVNIGTENYFSSSIRETNYVSYINFLSGFVYELYRSYGISARAFLRVGGDEGISYEDIAILISEDNTITQYFSSCYDAATYANENSSINWNLIIRSGRVPNSCFSNTTNLISLTLEEGVTSIGNYAFRSCTGLTGSLVIPDSVTSIGERAFYSCTGFDGNLTIGNSVTNIAYLAFYSCRGFTGSLVIPDSVTNIGQYAFYNCSGFDDDLSYYGLNNPSTYTNVFNNTSITVCKVPVDYEDDTFCGLSISKELDV